MAQKPRCSGLLRPVSLSSACHSFSLNTTRTRSKRRFTRLLKAQIIRYNPKAASRSRYLWCNRARACQGRHGPPFSSAFSDDFTSEKLFLGGARTGNSRRSCRKVADEELERTKDLFGRHRAQETSRHCFANQADSCGMHDGDP